MREPEHIKGVLPPSFRAWYQLLRCTQEAIKAYPELKTIVWFEMHPAGLRQGYEFTLDEIKAKALDEFINDAQSLVKDEAELPDKFYDVYSMVKARFLEP
jgi:hypothetical protein